MREILRSSRTQAVQLLSPGMFKSFLIVGDSAVRPADHPWSALCVVKSCPKRLPNGQGAAEAKAAALHPKWYQSSLSKLSTEGQAEAGKRSVGNRIGQQIRSIERVIDRRVKDRQAGRNWPMRAGHQADRAASYIAPLGRCGDD
jgi:hypothetical protein